MKTIGTIVALVLVSSAAQAATPTYGDCQSAYNAAYSHAWQLTSSVMNRVSCADASVNKGETLLARQVTRQKIPAHNTQELKVCFYAGFYAGYVDTLAEEYGDCGKALGLSSVARAASAVFIAMHEVLLDVDNGVIDDVFDGVFIAPSLEPEPLAEQCDEVIYAALLAADETPDLEVGLTELVDSVCRND